jgi:hypothetical protein
MANDPFADKLASVLSAETDKLLKKLIRHDRRYDEPPARPFVRLLANTVASNVVGVGASIDMDVTTIAENLAPTTTFAQLSVVDGGAGPWTYGEGSDPSNKFAVETNGEVWLENAVNFEDAGSHQLGVSAFDGVTLLNATFTITVTNVLEVTLAALSLGVANEIFENEPEDTVVGPLANTSAGSTLSIPTGEDAGGRFKLSGSNVVAGATPCNYEAATSHEITVRETHADGSNSPRDTILTINVIDVAEGGGPSLDFSDADNSQYIGPFI